MNWQSWSPLNLPKIKFPIRNFNPLTQASPSNIRPKNFRLKQAISGVCSWYRFGHDISEKNLLDFATNFKIKYPQIGYSLIDDGWCKWGDWQNPRININNLSKKFHKLNLKTGLWFAPFLADPASSLFQKHPEYFIKHNNKFVEGIKISPIDRLFPYKKYLLDFCNPEVKNYIYNSIKTAVEDWNVSLLKLDFLYAIYFDPRLKTDEAPHTFLVDLFKWIKCKYPHVYLMVCGCPFKPAQYLVDSIRISDDISLPYLYKFPILSRIFNLRQIAMLKNKWSRSQHLSRFFHLDPDVIPDPLFSHHSQRQIKEIEQIVKQSKVCFYS